MMVHEGKLQKSAGKAGTISLLIVLVLLVLSFRASSAGTNSCIVCHTDGEKMKSLVVPPKIHAEGEG